MRGPIVLRAVQILRPAADSPAVRDVRRQRRLYTLTLAAVVAALVVVAAGCGTHAVNAPVGSHARSVPGARSRGAQHRVERALAISFATSLVNMDGPVPAARARAAKLAARVVVECGEPRDGYYPCRIRLGSQGSEPCSVAVGHAWKVIDARCGGTRPQVITRGYVDCSSLGHSTTISDAIGDTSTYFGSTDPSPRRVWAPWIDLTSVRFIVTSTLFCADFDTAAPIRHGTVFSMVAGPAVPGQTGTEPFSPSLAIQSGRPPDVRLLSHGAVSAQVGINGRSASLTIELSDLPAAEQQLLRSSVTVSVHAAYLPPGANDRRAISDDAR